MSLFVKKKGFYQRILSISLPIAAQQVITVGVNMMDTIMLGQSGEIALSASSMAVQVHNLFHFMCMGLSMGAAVLIARFWGAGEERSLRKTLTLMYRFALLLGLIFTLAVGIAPGPILSLLTPDGAVIAEGVRYLRWALPCFFLVGLSLPTTHVLRNCGKASIPLFSSIGAFFINIFFNWVFIFGKMGAPAMGVAGAALGTTISRVFEFCVICGYFLFKEKEVRFKLRDLLLPCGDLLPEYIRISMPVLISDTLLGLGTSVTVSIVGHISQVFMSAHTITTVTQQVTSVFSASLGQSSLIIIGNTLGQGKAEEAQKQGVTFAVLGFLIGIVCCLFLLLISPAVVGYYKITAETHAVAMELMGSMAIVTIFMVTSSLLTKGILRGGGDTRFLMVADIFFLWAVSVPLGALAGLVWDRPPFWVFFCLKSEHLLKTILCLFRLKCGKWIKKIKAV